MIDNSARADAEDVIAHVWEQADAEKIAAALNEVPSETRETTVGTPESELSHSEPCCGEYEKCVRACTPRGEWLASRKAVSHDKQEKELIADGRQIIHAMERDGYNGIIWVKVLDALEARLSFDKKQEELMELAGFCWLIEKKNALGQPFYWTGRNSDDLTDDPYSALRFHSKEAAERIYMMCVPFPCHIVEHHFAVSARTDIEGDAARYRKLRTQAYRTSDLEPPHWCIPETCGLGADIDDAIDKLSYVGEKK